MPDEPNELAKADLDIIETQERIADQIQRIEDMAQEGLETTLAKTILRLLCETLDQWYIHRKLILEAITLEDHQRPRPGAF